MHTPSSFSLGAGEAALTSSAGILRDWMLNKGGTETSGMKLLAVGESQNTAGGVGDRDC